MWAYKCDLCGKLTEDAKSIWLHHQPDENKHGVLTNIDFCEDCHESNETLQFIMDKLSKLKQ